MEPDAAVRTVGRVSARGELGANAAVVAVLVEGVNASIVAARRGGRRGGGRRRP